MITQTNNINCLMLNAMPLYDRISAIIIEVRNVLLDPLGASKKKNPPCPADTASIWRSLKFFIPYSEVGHCE